MILKKNLGWLLFFAILQVFSEIPTQKTFAERNSHASASSEDYCDVSSSEIPKVQEVDNADNNENSSSDNNAPQQFDAGAGIKRDESGVGATCLPSEAAGETELEAKGDVVKTYTHALLAAVAESTQTIFCSAQMSVDHSSTKPENREIAEILADAFNNALSAATPCMLTISPMKFDLKSAFTSEADGGSSVSLIAQPAANSSMVSKPFDNFVAQCANSSPLSSVSQIGAKVAEKNCVAQAMHNVQKAPDFNAAPLYGPRYTEIVPKLTFKSSGYDIHQHISSVEGRQVIQQAKNALVENMRSMDSINNRAFLQSEESKVLTCYSKEVENKPVGYFIVSNKNIENTLAQLAVEKRVVQERLLLKQRDLQKLLSKKGVSGDELEALKIKLIHTPDQMSSGSYNQLKLIIQIIPLQNEVIDAMAQLLVNETNIRLAHQCQEINNQQLERITQSLCDHTVNLLNVLNYNDCKVLMSTLQRYRAEFESTAAESLIRRDMHTKKVEELNTRLKSAWRHKNEIKADITKEREIIVEVELSYQTVAKCAEIFSKIIVAGQEIIDKKALEVTPAQALKKYEPIIQAQGYDSSTIQYHENNLAALYQYTEHSDLTTAMSVTYQEQGAIVSAVYKVDPKVSDALERLGVNVHTINAEFTGNHVQHYVHRELINSLSKIATIEHTSPQVDGLLKTAVALNNTGRALNKRHEIVAALSAKEACDAVLEYAKVVATVGRAVAEGVVEGAVGTFNLLGTIGKEAVDAITFPDQAIELVQTKFNNAVLAIGKLFSGARMMREDYHYLFLHGDAQDIQEKFEQDRISGEKIVKFFEALEHKYHETPFEDKVKCIARTFTELALLGKIGGFLLEEGAAVADLIKLEAQAAGIDIQAVLAKPQQALAKEVIELAVKTVDKDAKLVKGAIEFIQQDAEFLAAAQKDIVQKTSQFIEHLEAKGARYTTLKTGERCRLVYPKDAYTREVIWSPKKYDEIRALTDDVQKIAKNVNMSESKIKCIKDHLFYDEHILDDGIRRFDPYAEIASAWDRLYKGDFIQDDLKLLEHEYFESKFEKALNLNYRDAHKKALDAGKVWDHPEYLE